jgi:NAD(P)-dependent dehydrogenase (short-subunit alcohol dehydrogenase family)
MKLEGKVALITGAGSGIGKAMALLFAREGADIAVNDINLSSAEKTTEDIREMGKKAITVRADVAEEKEVVAMVDRTIKELGGIHILVNNAGIGGIGPVLESTVESWDRVNAVILRGTYLCSREAGRWMVSQNAGKIVNISSIAALRFRVNMSSYASAKAGVVNLTRALALEWAPYHINVNCIIPGGINTPMTQASASTRTAENIKELIPLGRMGEPEDIADAALFLVSDDARWITGVALPVDGGELTRF